MRGRQMAAGGMARKAEARGIGPPLPGMGCQEIDRPADLVDDGAHTYLGRERIFDKRHVVAVRERAGGDMGELFLGKTLPIAPVDESQGRRPDVRARDPVY